MTKLMSWRNTEGTSLADKIKHGAKVVATQLSLPLLTLSALVETAIYKALHLGAQALKPITERPLKWINAHSILDRKESSYFTIRWTATMLYHNVMQKALPVQESDAEQFLTQPKTAVNDV